MRTFTDSAARTWTLSLTIDAAKRVRSLLDVNLLEPEKGDPPLLTRLGTDVILLCDVIYALVKPQADAAEVTDEQFGAALGGEVILAAQTAFYEEMVDFFRGLARKDLARAVETQQRMIELTVKGVEERIGKLDVEAEVEAILRTPGDSSHDSPGPSESTPGP